MSNQPKSKSEMKRLNVAQGRDIAEGVNEFGKSEQSKPKEFVVYHGESGYQVTEMLGAYTDRKVRYRVIDKAAFDALSAKCAELESRMADMVPNDDLTMQRAKTASQMLKNSELMDEVESLRAQLSEAQGYCEELDRKNETLKREIHKMKVGQELANEHMTNLERELAELKLKLENIAIEKLNDNRDMKIRVLESQNADLQRCCDLHDVRVAERNEAREMLAEKERELAEVSKRGLEWLDKCNAERSKLAELKKLLAEKEAEIEKWKSTFGACPACGEEFVTLATTPFFNLTLEAENQLLRTDWVKMKAALESTASTGCYHCSGDASETLADLKYKGE